MLARRREAAKGSDEPLTSVLSDAGRDALFGAGRCFQLGVQRDFGTQHA